MDPRERIARPPHLAVLLGWNGATVRDPQGRRCGTVVAPLVDRESAEACWLLVRQRDGFRCVPVLGTVGASSGVHVTHSAQRVRSSLPVDGTGALSARQEARLCAEYGIPPTAGAARASWERRRTTAQAVVLADGRIAMDPPQRSFDRPRDTSGLSVLVAHPDPEVAGRLQGGVRQRSGRLRICADVRTGPAAIRAALDEPPDLAVLGLELPLLDGPTTATRIRGHLPDVLVAFLSPDAGALELLDGATVLAPDTVPALELLGVLERLRYGVAS